MLVDLPRTWMPSLAAVMLVAAGGQCAGAAAWEVVITDSVGASPAGKGRWAFRKTSLERRSLVCERQLAGAPAGTKTLIVRYSLQLKGGGAARLAVVAFEAGGGAYLGVSSGSLVPGEDLEEPIAMAAPPPAAFSEDLDGKCDWPKIERLWVGLVLDAPAEGAFALTNVAFSRDPWRPTRPVPLAVGPNGVWQLGHDPAVKATLTTPKAGPTGQRCMQIALTMPGGRHMWVTATRRSVPMDLTAFHGVRFRLNARVPKGSVRVLVTLAEPGREQHVFEPPAGPPDAWRTVTIPFAEFRHAAWSEKVDGKLDPARIASVTIGMHGTASEPVARGRLLVTDLQYVPAPRRGAK